MITDKDVTKLKKVFATKDDLKQFAKKDDLKNFATKDDLKQFAKKDDLKNFATKDDLMRFATKDDLVRLEEKTDAIQETVQGLVTGIDKIAGKIDNLHYEYVALKLSDDRQNRQLSQIAKKIDLKLEM